jgi:hypothetical protein
MISEDHAKLEDHVNHVKRYGVKPVYVALAIAIFGVTAMLLVDHGPWARPHVQTADVANYHTTGEAARSVVADVAPTPPTSAIEPEPPVPRQIDPPNPKQE